MESVSGLLVPQKSVLEMKKKKVRNWLLAELLNE